MAATDRPPASLTSVSIEARTGGEGIVKLSASPASAPAKLTTVRVQATLLLQRRYGGPAAQLTLKLLLCQV